ncbi:MAG: sigma-54-dependent Fis family transcriptional regulator [bacterium]|nr:sigma-54-dependent Fis family transcriptional regulator [bacterium]
MTETAFVLIVEDETAHGQAIAEALQRSNHACRVVSSGAEAVDSIRQRPPDVVITDYKLGGELDGLDVLRTAKQHAPDTEVILITAYGSEQLARDVLSPDAPHRAYDYLIKPLDIDVLRVKVDRAARQAITARQNRELREQIDRSFSFEGIIGASEALDRTLKRVRRLAPTKSTVLIVGDSGTGKELVARAIHVNSPRRGKPFKVVTAPPLPRRCWTANSSGTSRVRLPERWPTRRACCKRPTGGRCFSTRSATCRCPCRPSCCARWRAARSCRWAAPTRFT